MGERVTRIELDRAVCPVCEKITRFEQKIVHGKYRPLLFGVPCMHYKTVNYENGVWSAVWSVVDE